MSIITGERPRFRLAIFAAGALAAGTMGFAGPAQAVEPAPFAVSGTVSPAVGDDFGPQLQPLAYTQVTEDGKTSWQVDDSVYPSLVDQDYGTFDVEGLQAGTTYRICFTQYGEDNAYPYIQRGCLGGDSLEDAADITSEDATAAAEVTLPERGDVSGTVTGGHDDVNLSDTDVQFYKQVGSGDFEQVGETLTDEDGTYAIKLVQGTYKAEYRFYGDSTTYEDAWNDDAKGMADAPTFTVGETASVQSVHLDEELAFWGDPTISGTTTVGSVLTADPGNFADNCGPLSYSYTWKSYSPDTRVNRTVGTGRTYTLQASDAYALMTVDVLATATGCVDGEGSSNFSQQVLPVPDAAPATLPFAGSSPAVKGAGKVGKTLSAPVLAVPAGGTVTYQWYRVAKAGKHHRVITKAIGGARTSKYKLKKKDKGTKVFVTEVVTAPGYATAAVSTKPVRVH